MKPARLAILFLAVGAAVCFAFAADLEAQCGGGGCGGGGAQGVPGRPGGCGGNPSGPGCDDGMPKCPSAAIGGLPCDSMSATGTVWWVDSQGRPAPIVTAEGEAEQAPQKQEILEIEKACAELRPVIVYFWKRADPLETDQKKAKEILENIAAQYKKAAFYGTKASELLQNVYKKLNK